MLRFHAKLAICTGCRRNARLCLCTQRESSRGRMEESRYRALRQQSLRPVILLKVPQVATAFALSMMAWGHRCRNTSRNILRVWLSRRRRPALRLENSGRGLRPCPASLAGGAGDERIDGAIVSLAILLRWSVDLPGCSNARSASVARSDSPRPQYFLGHGRSAALHPPIPGAAHALRSFSLS